MTTQSPSQDEHAANATSAMEEPSAMEPPSPLSASQPLILPSQPEPVQEQAFYFEEEQLELGAPFVTPFQPSDALPTVQTHAQSSSQASVVPPASARPVTKTRRRPPLSLMMVAILVCVVVVVGLFITSALAQTTPPLQTQRNGSFQTMGHAGTSPQPHLPMTPLPAPMASPTNGTHDWVPQQFPAGWTNAGLQAGDGIEALRAAVAFNDREMSVDAQSVGTRNNHGGTLTAAMFLLTPAAKQRFVQNDLREVNNTLFDLVVTTKLVRLVVDPQPQLVKFAQQGQQQFAWVDVTFQLWQSQIDPKNPASRIEGKELDPATQQPRIHQMMVLLLRVPPQDAGNNPAMGGIGWLVSNYALDLPTGTTLNIVQLA